MTNHRILFTAPGIAEFAVCDVPVVGAGKVLVKLSRSSISSGTERANLVGDPNIGPGSPGQVVFPRWGGYSSVGEVTAVGEGIRSVRVGDRVSCSWSVHMRYCLMNENDVHLLPPEIDDTTAALLHIATFPLAAIRKCRLEIGESVIIMGQGVLGQLAVQLARAAGAAPVIAVDPVEAKRERALVLGADYALDPFAEDFAGTVKRITDGGGKVAIEVTGLGAGLDMVLDCMAPFGRVALLGCTRNSDFTIDYYRKVHGPGITLVGAHTRARPQYESHEGWWTERDDVKALIRLISLGRLNPAVLLEEVHSPEEAPAVYARLAQGGAFPMVQFDWTQLPD